jgi:hypothetical protein
VISSGSGVVASGLLSASGIGVEYLWVWSREATRSILQKTKDFSSVETPTPPLLLCGMSVPDCWLVGVQPL